MIVYFLVIVSILILTVINELREQHMSNGKSSIHKLTAFFIIALLSFVAGFRYNVGTDYYNYYSSYHYFKETNLTFDEPGIKVIAKLSSYIYDDPATMMFIAAVVTVVLMTTTIFRYTDCYWISALLYVFLWQHLKTCLVKQKSDRHGSCKERSRRRADALREGLTRQMPCIADFCQKRFLEVALCCWHGCFNGVRQYLAAAVLFAGHGFIRENKSKKWLLIVLIASLFHITAVIGLLFYFYPRIKLSFKNIVLTIMIVFMSVNIYDKFFDFIALLKNDSFDFEGVGAGYLLNTINPMRIAVAWVPIAFFFDI